MFQGLNASSLLHSTLSFDDVTLVRGQIQVLDGPNAAHLVNSLLELLDGELVHLLLVFGGTSYEVVLEVVIADAIRSIDQLVEEGLFAGRGCAEAGDRGWFDGRYAGKIFDDDWVSSLSEDADSGEH